MTTTPEPKDKLDAMTTQPTALSVAGVVANGPEGETRWHAVDWRAAEETVRRLRQRIFTALQAVLLHAFRVCLSRMRGNVPVRF